jgi:hypothetical protein
MNTLYFIMAGLVCSCVAKKQNKNPYIWFGVGCLAPICGVLFLLLIPMFKKYFRSKTHKKQDRVVTLEVTPICELNPEAGSLNKLWYFLDAENITVGPMSFPVFKQKWKEGKILPTTLIWNETLTSWQSFQDIFPKACTK